MAATSSEELQEAWLQVRQMPELVEPPIPKVPLMNGKTSTKAKLVAIQAFLNALEYNYTGTLYFDVNKNRSFKSIVSTAKEIVNEALPIQCLEAVFVSSYLTASLSDVERFPISFRSVAGSTVHRHIVLAIRHQGKWGALGLSRSDKLMYKDVKFSSLSELMAEFCECFRSLCHTVLKIYIGFPFSHDIHSSEKVEWRVLNLPLEATAWTDVASHMDTFAREALDMIALKKARGGMPENFNARFPLHEPETEQLKRSPEKRGVATGSFEFPTAVDGNDEGSFPPPPAEGLKTIPSPEKDDSTHGKYELIKELTSATSPPILVAPDQLVFKRALANTAQMLPTNVFLQNTTTSPFLIELEEPSGQLEIVTKDSASSDSAHHGQSGDAVVPKTTASFRISAKGMIVIAIKYRPRTDDDGNQSVHAAAAESAKTSKRTSASSSTTTAQTGGGNRTPRTIVTPRSSAQPHSVTSARQAKKTMSPSKKQPTVLPNAVQLRCTRLPCAANGTDDQTNDLEHHEHEVFVHQLPFTILTS
ncbi:TPA: hypothetical protein N0F65_012034 [Lagenidium giganteum]|uniref:Vasohibin n=1 Tax=Lagenidium giganteum TaxID=4803 RepID=A0AAV2YRT3_9STRA|nr:TPA: hypothetical protein N0F65_012034 [Lagenidium giganteum]